LAFISAYVILDFKKTLQFLDSLKHSEILFRSDVEHNPGIGNDEGENSNMAAAAILNFVKSLMILNHWTYLNLSIFTVGSSKAAWAAKLLRKYASISKTFPQLFSKYMPEQLSR